MNRQLKDEALDKYLEEEFIREADLIEQSLLRQDEQAEEPMSQEKLEASYEKLVEKLKAQGIYEEDEDTKTEDTVDEPVSEKVVPMPDTDSPKRVRRYRFARVAGFTATCALGVVAASMTSEANRKYFIENIEYFTGNDTKIDVDSTGGDIRTGWEEQEAIDDIENELGVKMPTFMYRPKSFLFYGYEIMTSRERALMEYSYNENIVVLDINKKEKFDKKGNYSLDGKEINKIYSDKGDIEVRIMEIKDKKDMESSLVAQWQIEDSVFYQLSGKMDKKEFITLIEKMVF